jgi:hypothetical protein
MTKRREGHNARNQAGLKATSGAREGFIVLFERDHAETRRCVLARGEKTATIKDKGKWATHFHLDAEPKLVSEVFAACASLAFFNLAWRFSFAA